MTDPWIDLTVRVTEPPEWDVQPNGDVEISFRVPAMSGGRVTLLLPPDIFKQAHTQAHDVAVTRLGHETSG